MKRENWNKEAFSQKGFAKKKFNGIKEMVFEAIRQNVDNVKEYLHPTAPKQNEYGDRGEDDAAWEQTQEQTRESSGQEQDGAATPVHAGESHIFRGLAALTVGNVTIVAIGALSVVALGLYLLVMKVAVSLGNIGQKKSNDSDEPVCPTGA